jgi:hypothetical protein
MQRGESFTGFSDIMFEDFIAGEAQGAVPDRSKEFLGPADKAIIEARKLLLRKLRTAAEAGPEVFRHSDGFDYGAIQAIATKVEGGLDWKTTVEELAEERSQRYQVLEAAE